MDLAGWKIQFFAEVIRVVTWNKVPICIAHIVERESVWHIAEWRISLVTAVKPPSKVDTEVNLILEGNGVEIE
jgi:hypothetical protein